MEKANPKSQAREGKKTARQVRNNIDQQTPTTSGQLFYAVFQASPIGIAVEDLEGRPLYANPAVCAMLGFSEREMQGKHCVEFSPAEDAQKDWALFEQLRAGSIDRYQMEKRFFRRDGSLMWGRLSVSLLKNGASPLVIAVVEDITEKRAAQDELQQSEANLQMLAGKLIQAQEDERRHIARELHDDISQGLALLSVGLEELSDTIPASQAPLRKRLVPLMKRTAEISSGAHALSHRLHSSRLETLGLVAAMKGFCRELAEQRNVEIDFAHGEVPDGLASDVSLCLFRVMQESLGNAVKYSGVRHFGVRLERVPDGLQLTVRDAGMGFDPERTIYQEGLGLISMRERVGFVKGTMSIVSKRDAGTEITVRVPLRAAASAAQAKSAGE